MLGMLTFRLCPLSKPVSPEKSVLCCAFQKHKMPAKTRCKVKQYFHCIDNNVRQKSNITSTHHSFPLSHLPVYDMGIKLDYLARKFRNRYHLYPRLLQKPAALATYETIGFGVGINHFTDAIAYQ